METTFLVLEDGTVYSGNGFGADAPYCEEVDGKPSTAGELVFNTSMTGYCEILTDPSYTGQIVMMTYPHIGNYGCDSQWNESTFSGNGIHATALVVRQAYDGPLPPGRISVHEFLLQHGICGINGVDTRSLTHHLRDNGSCNALLVRSHNTQLSEAETQHVLKHLRSYPKIGELDLITPTAVQHTVVDPSLPSIPTNPTLRFAVMDFGIKQSIIDQLYKRNIAVTLLPPTTTAEEIMHLSPAVDALFLSNGPGDPAALPQAVQQVRQLIGQMPVFGICLGHQLITLALGGATQKMVFGHHGANHPVRDLQTNRVFVTSQNHGYMTKAGSLPADVQPWFVNANDQSIEGLVHTHLPVMSVQFHPEASPGPHDATWIFDRFAAACKEGR